MRIISDFKDYYDGVQKMGQDQSIIYERKTRQLDNRKEVLRVVKRFEKHSRGTLGVARYLRHEGISNGTTQFGILMFCGKLYRYIVMNFNDRSHYALTTTEVICYTYDEVIALIESRGINRSLVTEAKLVGIKSFLSGNADDTSDLHFEYRTPVILYEFNHYRDQVIINPNLKQIEFFKVIDPYTTYQELSMYIGGVLTSVNNPSEVTNDIKIAKHGFDKRSFRKDPETTPRRKRR